MASKVGPPSRLLAMRRTMSVYSTTRNSIRYAANAWNNAMRDGKWWVTAPRETLARKAIDSLVVWL